MGLAVGLLVGALAAQIRAEEYRLETTDDAPPPGLAADVAARISPTGYQVFEGEKRLICEIWPAKSWAVKTGFKPSDTILYPFEIGELIGVLRFPRKGADFRDQDIGKGVYTLRYANQPVDGNHVGTFDTRDFLLMVPAKEDTSAGPIAQEALFKESADSAGATHPAIMPLLKPSGDEAPALHHAEERDWWRCGWPARTRPARSNLSR